MSDDLVQVATEFVYQLLRTSPGHLDTPVGKRLLGALDFVQDWEYEQKLDGLIALTRSEGVTDAGATPKSGGGR